MVDDYGTRLLTAMQARGVSAQQLAIHLGVSYQAIRKVLKGQSTALTATNNSYAARFLKISSDWLATGDGVMEETTPDKSVAPLDSALSRAWQSASAEAREVALFALSDTDAPLPRWADKDMRKDLISMRYAATLWLRRDAQPKIKAPVPEWEHKKIAAA